MAAIHLSLLPNRLIEFVGLFFGDTTEEPIKIGMHLFCSRLHKAGDFFQQANHRAMPNDNLPLLHFFGYPTDCARMIFWSDRSFSALARAGLSMPARTPVARPSEAQ